MRSQAELDDLALDVYCYLIRKHPNLTYYDMDDAIVNGCNEKSPANPQEIEYVMSKIKSKIIEIKL